MRRTRCPVILETTTFRQGVLSCGKRLITWRRAPFATSPLLRNSAHRTDWRPEKRFTSSVFSGSKTRKKKSRSFERWSRVRLILGCRGFWPQELKTPFFSSAPGPSCHPERRNCAAKRSSSGVEGSLHYFRQMDAEGSSSCAHKSRENSLKSRRSSQRIRILRLRRTGRFAHRSAPLRMTGSKRPENWNGGKDQSDFPRLAGGTIPFIRRYSTICP